MDIRAPEEQTEGTRSQVLRWLKGVGDSVAEHEPLIEIETDKVTVEVAAPASGVLREILKGEQEEVTPGEVLGRMETADAGQAADGSGRAGESGDGRSTPRAAQEDRAGDVSSTAATSASERRAAVEKVSASVAGAANAVGAATATGIAGAAALSPAVRRLLAER